MSSYKTEMTLNEKDSLQDMLNAEKTLVKLYAMAITEGASKGFREQIKENFAQATDSQFNVFSLMTRNGYYQVESAPETTLSEQRNKFDKIKGELC